MNYQIEIDPRDKLFFRDARPLGGSNSSSSANWPLPTLFHSALLTALHENGYDESWESEHKHLTDKERRRNVTLENKRFKLGGLKTYGPFPTRNRELYFPVPADIESSGSLMQPADMDSKNNLPKPLKYSVANTGGPSKDEIGQWIAASDLEKYLKGESVKTLSSSEIYTVESTPGVTIDPETHANMESKFYQAEYLRLLENEGFTMTAFAECEARKASGETNDVLKNFFETQQKNFIFGGQRGMAYMQAIRDKNNLDFDKPSGINIKWILLSPAIFNNGWLPDWIDPESGRIRLKERPQKGSLSRIKWREKIKNAPEIGAKLVAARIPKPTVMSGWKLDYDKDNAGGEAKATKLAVSAGSVYYFECVNEQEAAKLVRELHGQVKSTQFGEKGFGLGICGTWELVKL